MIYSNRFLSEFHSRDLNIIFGLASIGVVKVSLLQNRTFGKLIHDNDDLAIISPTGTGKTLTAALAAVHSVDTNKCVPQVLYICATLESAVQTHSMMCSIAHLSAIKIGLIAKNEHGMNRFNK